MIEIRRANENDSQLIFTFIEALADYEKLSHEVVTTPEELKKELFHKEKAPEVVFAMLDKKEVGFALFFQSFSTFLGRPGIYLEDLFVFPEYRGRGIGKKLLTHLAKLAIERGNGRLEWSVLDWNTPAIEFYKSLGAESMDGWTVNRVSSDALINLAKLN